MRKALLAVVWLLGCAPEGQEPAGHEGPEQPDHADERACDDEWRNLDCPDGFVARMFQGQDLVFLEIEDVAQPVCGGRGTFIAADDLEGIDHVGYNITQNTVCAFGCFGPCDANNGGDICITDRPNGDRCFNLCGGDIGEAECADGAQACNPDVACG